MFGFWWTLPVPRDAWYPVLIDVYFISEMYSESRTTTGACCSPCTVRGCRRNKMLFEVYCYIIKRCEISALLAICAWNSPVPGEFPAQKPVTRSFDVFFDLRLNKRLSKQSWGWWFETPSRPLWRHYNEHSMTCWGICGHSNEQRRVPYMDRVNPKHYIHGSGLYWFVTNR